KITTGTVAAARLPSSASAWTVSGSNVYRSSGNVGIGSTSPTQPIDIATTATGNPYVRITDLDTGATAPGFRASSNAGGFDLIHGGTGASSVAVLRSSSAGGMLIQSNNASGFVSLSANGTTGLTVNASGNVGIGTSSPSYRLDLTPSTSTVYDGLHINRAGS